MTDTLTAADRLAALESRILDGETVDPAELAAARAAVDVEQLAQTGRRRRAERKAAEEAERRREQAKADATALLAEHGIGECLAAYDQARDAIAALCAKLGEHNDAINQAARILTDAGVPEPPTGVQPKHWPADIDPRFHAQWGHGGRLGALTVDGRGHAEQDASNWVVALLLDASHAHNGFRLPYGQSIAERIRGGAHNVDALVEHRRAAA